MPIVVRKQGSKFRLVEKNTGRIAKNSAGSAVDGGGHSSQSSAQKQVNAINVSKHKKK